MKVNGRAASGPYIETCVIPRPPKMEPQTDAQGQPVLAEDGQPLLKEVPDAFIFKFQAVLDYSDFEKICPEPLPPDMIDGQGRRVLNPESPIYKKAITDWVKKKFLWAFLKSMSATEGLEWTQVKMDDPETWHLFEQELRDAGFSQTEIGRMNQAYATANCLDEAKLQAARDYFLPKQKGR